MISRSLYDSVWHPYTPITMSLKSHSDYCAVQVRTYDYDRYFAATFAPAETRRGLFALYAFNIEIASARERVSEALLGDLRLQWWRDAIGEIYNGSIKQHAVVAELAHAIETFSLPRDTFECMIDGRLFDLEEDAPEDINALDNYITATAGELVCASYRICGIVGQDDQARQQGSIWGGTGLLRALPFHLSQRRVYLPKDLLRKAGTTASVVADSGPRINLSPATAELAGILHARLNDNRKIEKRARPAAAYLALSRNYLRRLQRNGYDVFAQGLEGPRSLRQFGILRSIVSGKI